MADLLARNMSFTTSLDLNHEGGNFCLEAKIKKHKMVAPKGVISNDMWKRISRGIDKIDKIYKNTAEKLNLLEEDRYRQVDIYNEIVTWRAVLRCSGMLSDSCDIGVAQNIFGEPLSADINDLTHGLMEKMFSYWNHVGKGTYNNPKISYMHVLPDLDIECANSSESEYDSE